MQPHCIIFPRTNNGLKADSSNLPSFSSSYGSSNWVNAWHHVTTARVQQPLFSMRFCFIKVSHSKNMNTRTLSPCHRATKMICKFRTKPWRHVIMRIQIYDRKSDVITSFLNMVRGGGLSTKTTHQLLCIKIIMIIIPSSIFPAKLMRLATKVGRSIFSTTEKKTSNRILTWRSGEVRIDETLPGHCRAYHNSVCV